MSYNARSRMTMRCTIQRDRAIGNTDPTQQDGFGQGGTPDWQDIGGLWPCYAWVGGEGLKMKVAPERVISVGGTFVMFPKGTDVRIDDRISAVYDRLGNQIFGLFLLDYVYVRKNYIVAGTQEYK